MKSSRFAFVFGLVMLAASVPGLEACRTRDSSNDGQQGARERARARTADRLKEGEIPEGRERAFTLPLPLRSTVKVRFPETVHIVSELTHEELSNFVRARVKDGTSAIGATETRFDRVVAKSDTSKTLSIQIRQVTATGNAHSQMTVRDITAPPEPPGLTDTDRLRNSGLSPDGKLLDRNQLQ
jgi:hypothetical protein